MPTTTKSMPAKEALALLSSHGHRALQVPAPAGMCRTACYRVDGQAVNLGRLRELAAALNQPTSAEIGERNRRLMFGDNHEAFPSQDEWRRITD
jgi:hypothetical protein